ncbi:MAG: ABC transporter permease [Clostridiaceae bacterium]
MNTLILIKNTALNLRANKLRVFLTMIGIIIGISAVVAIQSVGAGLQAKVAESTEKTDVNTLNIVFENKSGLSTIVDPFTKSDLRILESIDGISSVEDASNTSLTGASMSGGEASYFDKKTFITATTYTGQSFNLVAGQGITEEDNEFENNVIILPETTAKDLFGEDIENGIGKGIKLNNNFYKVVGITKEVATTDIFNLSQAYIPSFATDNLNSNTSISSIKVKVKDGYNLDSVFEDIKSELVSLHPDLNGEYTKTDPLAIIQSFQKIIGYITLFITAVSSISLFVAGVGVMNIMYVSISERRREIGIRRAIGAKPKMILLQFLVEAVLITSIGGILGIIFGFGFSKIIGLFITEFKPVVTVSILFSSSITSVIVGIVFGIIPAFKAAKMDPIKAIYK